jgi:hypothetical protein
VRRLTPAFFLQLLVIEALQASGIPEHVDVAEILQNKLYYEAETLDMVVGLITKYNAQSYKSVVSSASCSAQSDLLTRCLYLPQVPRLGHQPCVYASPHAREVLEEQGVYVCAEKEGGSGRERKEEEA